MFIPMFFLVVTSSAIQLPQIDNKQLEDRECVPLCFVPSMYC